MRLMKNGQGEMKDPAVCPVLALGSWGSRAKACTKP